jgi:hypothetical protein
MMQEDAAEAAAAKTEGAKKAAATKPEPLAALPSWIPGVEGFKPRLDPANIGPATKERSRGPFAAIRTQFSRDGSSRPNRNSAVPTLPGHPTIGTVNGKHYVSLHTFRRDASCTDLCDLTLELDAAGGGKSTVKVRYIQPATGRGEKK